MVDLLHLLIGAVQEHQKEIKSLKKELQYWRVHKWQSMMHLEDKVLIY